MSETKRSRQKRGPDPEIEAYKNVMMRIPDCMAVPKTFSAETVFQQFLIWPKSKRKNINPANLIIDFQRTNRELLSFLGLEISCIGHDKNSRMAYLSSRYVGAIPTVIDGGMQGGDIFVYPRMQKDTSSDSDALAQLTSVLLLLDENIEPEFYPSAPLKNPVAVRPPLYYEAIKYIKLYEQAIRTQWRKFRTEKKEYSYPKGSTDWGKYAQRFANPQNWTRFPARDSVLTVNHPEWQELKYVFELAAEELTTFSAPSKLRMQYRGLIQELENRTKDIPARRPITIKEHVADPAIIKELKKQAQVLLSRRTNQCTAWRIDVAKVFETYVQYVLERAFQQFEQSYSVHSNTKFVGKGHIPHWGLRYLEPDIVLSRENVMLIADAKYKANLFAKDVISETLKETHRHDLHQLLAYCSFAPQKDKLAMLVYPYDRVYVQEMSYQDPFVHTKNTVLLVGLPFEAEHVQETIEEVKEKILQKYLTQYMEEQNDGENLSTEGPRRGHGGPG